MARPKAVESGNGRRKQEEKYERILGAALQIFAANGYHEAKISEIARAAGVADGTIYLYFKNKDDILISLFEAHLEAINNGLGVALADVGDPVARMEVAIRYHLQLAANNPPLAQFITVELRRSSKFMKDYAKSQFVEYLGHFEGIFKHGKKNGTFRDDLSTGMLTQVLFGALDYACVTWVNNPNREPEHLSVVGDFLVDFVGRAISARSEKS